MYNYPEFLPSNYNFKKQTGLMAGDTLPDLNLQTLGGRAVNMADFSGKTLVIETGSLTCPLYVGKIKTMNALARARPDVNFLVIYVREAHPGARIPTHDDMAGKVKNANMLAEKEPENRVITVDNMNGDAHRALGLLPNMAFIIDASGKAVFRADWNLPSKIDEALVALERGEPIDPAPVMFTPVAPSYSLRVLARAGGLRAVWQFLSHLPALMKQHKSLTKR